MNYAFGAAIECCFPLLNDKSLHSKRGGRVLISQGSTDPSHIEMLFEHRTYIVNLIPFSIPLEVLNCPGSRHFSRFLTLLLKIPTLLLYPVSLICAVNLIR